MLSLIATLVAIASLLGAAERVDPESGVRTRPDSVQRRVDLAWMVAYVMYAPVVGVFAGWAVEGAAGGALLGQFLSALPWGVRLAGAVVVAELEAWPSLTVSWNTRMSLLPGAVKVATAEFAPVSVTVEAPLVWVHW